MSIDRLGRQKKIRLVGCENATQSREVDENSFQNIKIDKMIHHHQFQSCKNEKSKFCI
jgi:hypothetical protein